MTLWERVAEMGESGVVNSPNYTPKIALAYFKCTGWSMGRGIPIMQTSEYMRAILSSGVIKKGIRVK